MDDSIDYADGMWLHIHEQYASVLIKRDELCKLCNLINEALQRTESFLEKSIKIAEVTVYIFGPDEDNFNIIFSSGGVTFTLPIVRNRLLQLYNYLSMKSVEPKMSWES